MVISGDITVLTIDKICIDLLSAIKKKKSIKIDIAGLAEVDLTFIQLIESARIYAAKAGRQIALAQPVSAPVRQILQRGGFLEDPASDRTKFWLQGAISQ